MTLTVEDYIPHKFRLFICTGDVPAYVRYYNDPKQFKRLEIVSRREFTDGKDYTVQNEFLSQ